MALAPALGSGEGRAVGALRINLVRALVEVRVPQAKPLLVRLSPFRLNIRPGKSARTVRDEILAVLPELIDEHGELMMCDLLSRLNPEGDNRRRWAVEKAVWRMANTAPFETLSLEHLSQGRYRSPHCGGSV